MRYGYWLPVFGGWLRNVEDERMSASWDYVKRLAQRSEEIGYDNTLIAGLLLNDIKGIQAPSLDAWATAAAPGARPGRLGAAADHLRRRRVGGREDAHRPQMRRVRHARRSAGDHCAENRRSPSSARAGKRSAPSGDW